MAIKSLRDRLTIFLDAMDKDQQRIADARKSSYMVTTEHQRVLEMQFQTDLMMLIATHLGNIAAVLVGEGLEREEHNGRGTTNDRRGGDQGTAESGDGNSQ